MNYPTMAVNILNSYQCLKTKEIGAVRESLELNIFNENDSLLTDEYTKL
jgi:hypothetical protein